MAETIVFYSWIMQARDHGTELLGILIIGIDISIRRYDIFIRRFFHKNVGLKYHLYEINHVKISDFLVKLLLSAFFMKNEN